MLPLFLPLLQLYRCPEHFAADLLVGALQVRYDTPFQEFVLLPWHTSADSRFSNVVQRSVLVMPSAAADASVVAGEGRGQSRSGRSWGRSGGNSSSRSGSSSRDSSRGRSRSRDSRSRGRRRGRSSRSRSSGRDRGRKGKEYRKEQRVCEERGGPAASPSPVAPVTVRTAEQVQWFLGLTLPTGISAEHADELREAAVLLSFLNYVESSVDGSASQEAALRKQLVLLAALQLPLGFRGGQGRCSVEEVVGKRCGKVLLRCDEQGKADQAGGLVRLGVGYMQAVLQHQYLKEQKGQLVVELWREFQARAGVKIKHLREAEYRGLLQKPHLGLYQQVGRFKF